MNDDMTTPLDLYLTPLRERWKLILVITILAVIGGTTLGLLGSTSYQSTTSILVNPISGDPTESVSSGDVQVDMPTEMRIATSVAVIQLVEEELASRGIQVSRERLSTGISASSTKESRILDLAYEASTPERAQTTADVFGRSYLAYRVILANENKATARSAIDARIADLKDQLVELDQELTTARPGSQNQINNQVEKSSVEGELAALQEALADLSTLTVDAGAIIADASVPEAAEGLGVVQIILGSLVAGLAIGILVAFFVNAITSPIRGPGHGAPAWVPQPVAQPIMTVPTVPDPVSSSAALRPYMSPAAVEPEPVPGPEPADQPIRRKTDVADALATPLIAKSDFRDLLEKLEVLKGHGSAVCLSLSQTTAHASLAMGFEVADAAQAQGRSVLLIDLLLTDPLLHDLVGLPIQPGLADVLAERCRLAEAISSLDGLDDLDVMTAGQADATTGLAVNGYPFERTISEAAALYDVVVVIGGDFGDVRALANAARCCDGLVVASELDPGEAVDQLTTAQLESMPVPTLEVIAARSEQQAAAPAQSNDMVELLAGGVSDGSPFGDR